MCSFSNAVSLDGPTKEPEEGFDSQKFTFKSPAEDPSGLFPSSEDWENILSGTRQAKYQKGEIVLHQEQETPHLLYQISNGYVLGQTAFPFLLWRQIVLLVFPVLLAAVFVGCLQSQPLHGLQNAHHSLFRSHFLVIVLTCLI